MTSYMEAARDAAEYDECEHGVPGGNDCVDCMKRAHADEIRALNEEAEDLATDLADIRAALRLPASTPWLDVLARARRLADLDPGRTLDDEGMGGGDGGGR